MEAQSADTAVANDGYRRRGVFSLPAKNAKPNIASEWLTHA
jgi:hypothetical protein